MLPKQGNKSDIDGYAMLLLSSVMMFATAGLSYAYFLRKIYHTAKTQSHLCKSDADVLLLGKKLVNDQPDNEYRQRLDRAHDILKNDQTQNIIILGGITGNASISEAHAGKRYLENKQVDASRIILEQASRNTLENIKNATAFLNEQNKKIVVVSNRYHLLRAKQMAKGFGLNVELCAAEDRLNLNALSVIKLMIEAVHLHWYNTGRIYARLTNNQRMLNRIGKF